MGFIHQENRTSFWICYNSAINLSIIKRLTKKSIPLNSYRKDQETGRVIIQISLDKYDDVFDDWDSSPFKMRDIEDEFLDFIWDSIEDIPSHMDVIFEFSIPQALQNEQKEKVLISALNHQFDYMLRKIKRQRIKDLKETLRYFSIGVFFFIVFYTVFDEASSFISQIIKDGLFVGGWLFIWETFSNIFIKSYKLSEERQIIQRFKRAQIKFILRP